MTYQAIPGLAFNGKQVYVDDGATTSTGPVVSPPPPVSLVTTIPAVNVGMLSDDNFYLTKMIGPYRSALISLPGSHQIYFDMLTDGQGRTWSDGVPQPVGTVFDANLKNLISNLINAASYNMPLTFTAATYNGPLKQVYANLVAKKLNK